MKDYSMNLEEKKLFILGYKIKNGFMKVKYALGFKDNIQHNEENETKVLDKMKKQVLNIDEDKFVRNKRNNICFDFIVGSVCVIVSTLLFGMKIVPGREILAYIFGCLFTVGGVILIPNGFVQISKLQDYKKNKRFIEIEDEINKKVRKHENMLVNVSGKTKKIVNSTSEEKPVFNINSFNYVPNRDLEQIMENISRDEYFKYKYEESSVKETKPKTRTRRKEEQN